MSTSEACTGCSNTKTPHRHFAPAGSTLAQPGSWPLTFAFACAAAAGKGGMKEMLSAFFFQSAVIGSCVVASQPAGIGIREDDRITRDTVGFCPLL